MKKIVLSTICMLVYTFAFAQLNMTFKSKKTYSGELSNIGGYVDSLGNEYALVGWEFGLSIVDVTDPLNIFEVINISGPQSIWREVKTHDKYAYVTTEGGGGLQIINLSNLPANNLPVKNYLGNGAISGQIDNIHALHIDEGYIYLYGTSLFNGAALICDLNSDPWNPNYLGHTPGTYIHDGYVRNDTLFSCHIYDGYFTIFDVSNKANPIALNTQNTPDNFSHNSWLNDAGTVLFTTDEVDNSVLAAYDISNPQNIKLIDQYQTAPGSQAIVHNTHTLNDYEVVSWYTEGVVVVDVARPDNMIEVGHYDTSPFSGGGFNGCWGVYCYLPSGNLVVSDIEEGLFVIAPDYIRGCYLEGLVTDSITTLPINGATVTIVSSNKTKFTNTMGVYKTGLAAAGLYDVTVSKVGYITKTITGVSLANGIVTALNVELVPVQTLNITGNVIDAGNGNPIANANVNISDGQYNWDVITNGNGDFSINNFVTGTYTVTAGQWGYITSCNTAPINGGNVTIALSKGWYDDFTFDNAWSTQGTATTGFWVREEPIGTTSNNTQVNPDFDVITDCNDKCFMSGNGGGSSGNDDIDDGSVTLRSPFFDLSNYTNPVLYYSRWFYNGGGQFGSTPNDTMYVYISNGATEVLLEKIHVNTPGMSNWINKLYALNNYLTPTTTMRVRVVAEDFSQGNVCEAAFDKFQVSDGFLSIDHTAVATDFTVAPNPASIDFLLSTNQAGDQLTIQDITGKIIEQLTMTSASIRIGAAYQAGLYFATLTNKNGGSKTLKLIKTQ
ncbi:MAG: choice-of-anchor B family protein [Bacteroidetes bacterium]|nr:choice-of-anchor B family protein [Bacteroidota bacterium]